MDTIDIKLDTVKLEPKIRKIPEGKFVTDDGTRFKVVPYDYELKDGEFWFSLKNGPDLKYMNKVENG